MLQMLGIIFKDRNTNETIRENRSSRDRLQMRWLSDVIKGRRN